MHQFHRFETKIGECETFVEILDNIYDIKSETAQYQISRNSNPNYPDILSYSK